MFKFSSLTIVTGPLLPEAKTSSLLKDISTSLYTNQSSNVSGTNRIPQLFSLRGGMEFCLTFSDSGSSAVLMHFSKLSRLSSTRLGSPLLASPCFSPKPLVFLRSILVSVTYSRIPSAIKSSSVGSESSL